MPPLWWNRAFRKALTDLEATHKLIRPCRPQTNGKVERYNQIILRGWAFKQPTPPTSNDAEPSPSSSAPTITKDPTAASEANRLSPDL